MTTAADAARERLVIRSPELLAQAVNAAHANVPMLGGFVQACQDHAAARDLA